MLLNRSRLPSVSALTGLLLLLSVFLGTPVASAATAPKPSPDVAMPLSEAFDYLDSLLEPYGLEGALDGAESLFNAPNGILPNELLDPDRPHHTYEIPEGVTETYGATDTVNIADDWIVRGTLVLNGAEVVFQGPRFIRIESTGILDVNPGTRFRATPVNLDAPGVIIQRGGGVLDVDGTASNPVRFTDVSISTARPVWTGPIGSTSIDHARFDHVRVAIQARHAAVEVHRTAFTRTAVGVQILDGNTTYEAKANVENSTFIGNEIGVKFDLGQNNLGKVTHSSFRANGVGVNCLNHNETAGTRPLITHNNFTMNYQEAYEGRIGLTVTTPAATVSIAPSKCRIANNYIHSSNGVYPPTDSALDNDEYNGNQGTTPWTDLQNPPEPVTPRIITNIQTWNAVGGHILNQPVVVTQGGDLRVQNTRLYQNDYPLGSTLGGKFRLDNSRSDNAIIIARTANSVSNGFHIEGNSLYTSPFIVYRNSATHTDFTALNVTKGTAFLARGGIAVDDVWSITLDGCYGRNVYQFVVTLLMTLTLTGCDWDYVFNGVIAAIGQATVTDIVARHFNLAITSLINALTASNLRLDGGVSGVISAIDQSLDLADGYVTSTRIAVGAVIEVNGATMDNFHLAFNLRGFLNAASATTITDSNFEHNYFFAIENVAVSNAQSTISCTCWSPTDEDTEGVVTFTQPLNNQPYPSLKPTWWGQQQVVETPSNVTITGRLQHPVMARNGGILYVADTTIDGILEQPIGVKNDRNNAGSPGRLIARNAVFRDLNFMALDSPNTEFVDTDFGPGAFLTSLDHHPSARCTNWQFPGTYWTLIGSSASTFTVRRSHLMDNHGITIGTTSTEMDLTLEDNLIGPESYGKSSLRTILTRTKPGDWAIHGNNVGPQLRIIDEREAAADGPLQMDGNFLGHPSGPRLVEFFHPLPTSRDERELFTTETGTMLKYWETNPAVFEPDSQQVLPLQPCVRFDLPQGSVTDGAAVPFLDRSFPLTPDGVSDRRWTWGDGDPSESLTTTTPTHQFRDAGTFTVSLRIQAPLAQWSLVDGAWVKTTPTTVEATLSKTLTVANAPPVAQFTWTPTVAPDDTSVGFSHSSFDPSRLGSVTGVLWNFGDGTTSTAAAPNHLFPDDGTYNVCLTATDNDGATHQSCRSVDVSNAPPTVTFTHSPTVPDDGHAAAFTSNADDPSPSGSIVSYAWVYGDSESGTGANPTHVYRNDGTYTTCVTVADDDGATAQSCHPVTVTNAPPVAAFAVQGTGHTDGAPVAFLDQSTDPSRGGPITAWAWSFGDGTTSSQRNPSHGFPSEGVFQVCLTVTDGDGASDNECAGVTVLNAPPRAEFTFTPTSPDPGGNVTFDATTSLDPSPGGAIVSYQWTFGDGATGTGATFTRSFPSDGIYNVTLVVTDDDGATGSRTSQIGVGNRAPYFDPYLLFGPVLEGRWIDDIIPAVDPERQPLTYSSPDLPAGATLGATTGRFRWRPADGQAGEYEPTVIVSDGQLTASRTLELTVLDNRGPTMTLAMPTLTEARRTDSYQATVSDPEGTAVSVVWTFNMGGGNIVTKAGKTVTHSFPTMGSYAVTATATDADGIQTAITRTVNVDDILLVAVQKVSPSGSVQPNQPVVIRVTVTNDLNLPVAGASVSVAIRNMDLANLQSTVAGTTDASGVFQFSHAGETTVAHLPGDHSVTATATNPSRPGAPNTAPESASATTSYHVVGDPDDLCPFGDSLEDCTNMPGDIIQDAMDMVVDRIADFCGGRISANDCLANVPNPCSYTGDGTSVQKCVDLVEGACEGLGDGEGTAACVDFVLGLVGTITGYCENMGDSPGVGGCVDYVTDLIDCDAASGATGQSQTQAAGCIPQNVVKCVTDLLGETTMSASREQIACELT